MKKNIGTAFMLMGLLSLLAGLIFGVIGSLQFYYPGFFDAMPFFKSRPLHVSLVVAWIFSGAVGGVYYYLPKYCNLPLFSTRLATVHFWLFLLTGLGIIGGYVAGVFGGREYWAFPPVFVIPIVISWGIFAYNFLRTVMKKKGPWPVYLWMWATGVAFFMITYLESNLYHIPWFRDDVIRDVTVQWKSYGSLVGSWNMLVYGTAIFIMERLSKNSGIALSKAAWLMYMLGLTNLMLGWAHHTYPVPSADWIRSLAYAVSMSELLILGKIIWTWKKTVTEGAKNFYSVPFRFLLASDWWVFLNLVLALGMSIPALNLYSHGTHVTVAHAMGSTIGINTMILMASLYFVVSEFTKNKLSESAEKMAKRGYWIVNISLLLFWLFLNIAGIIKGLLMVEKGEAFASAMSEISPYIFGFVISGFGLFIGLLMIILPLVKALIANVKQRGDEEIISAAEEEY